MGGCSFGRLSAHVFIVVLNILYVDLIWKDSGKKAVDDKATVFSVKSLNQENQV